MSDTCNSVNERQREWFETAQENVDEWGQQSAEVLLLAMQEELGELTQAVLEHRHEDRHYSPIYDELDDLAPLLIQFLWAVNGHNFNTGTEQSEAGQ